MKTRKACAAYLFGAALLSALAPAPRAAAAVLPKKAPASASLDDLQSGVARPDDFQRFVEGSRERADAAAAPRASAPWSAGRAANAAGRLGAPRPGLSLETAARIPAPGAEGIKPPSAPIPGAELPLRGLSAVLGLGFMMIATSLIIDAISPAPAPEPLPAAPALEAAPAAASRFEFSSAVARIEAAAEPAPFIDVRMPAPTWRAISLAEQEVIERWDASREKRLGLASLTEWIGAQGSVDGVDLPLLQAKLHRDA
jgi:hypothetical protein